MHLLKRPLMLRLLRASTARKQNAQTNAPYALAPSCHSWMLLLPLDTNIFARHVAADMQIRLIFR